MPLFTTLLAMPDKFEQLLAQVPADHLDWEPVNWAGIPSERFSARGHLCHLLDIETQGYQVRFRRTLEESLPALASLDGYQLAQDNQYRQQDPAVQLARFRAARLGLAAARPLWRLWRDNPGWSGTPAHKPRPPASRWHAVAADALECGSSPRHPARLRLQAPTTRHDKRPPWGLSHPSSRRATALPTHGAGTHKADGPCKFLVAAPVC
ncbi:hypothetical protein [Aeromonas enteropelogenes]|uniref:hypothetical protein n=1 Tax=Aeromonas enteropelogenes TaxID=29489 RepID=UPI003BA2CD5F